MLRVAHFDINGCIIAFDSTDCASQEDVVYETIARSIMGTVVSGSFTRDETGSTTYYDFLKKKYPDHYKTYARCILSVFPDYGEIATQLKNISGIFPSFFQFRKENPDVKIMFRTFGHDADFVIDQLNEPCVKVSAHWCDDSCYYLLDDEIVDLCELVKTTDKHIVVQEDYHHWNDHKKEAKFGKIIKPHPDLIQYGFDDNPCMHVMPESGEVYVFRVNTVQAGLDENYFVKLVNEI